MFACIRQYSKPRSNDSLVSYVQAVVYRLVFSSRRVRPQPNNHVQHGANLEVCATKQASCSICVKRNRRCVIVPSPAGRNIGVMAAFRQWRDVVCEAVEQRAVELRAVAAEEERLRLSWLRKQLFKGL